jgi:osmotically-inducible protein OsmY
MQWRAKSVASFVTAVGLLLVVPGSSLSGQEPQPDNTKVNKRDRKASEPTADQAKETSTDRTLMQNIRKAIMADESMSTYAKNVKVISENGKITLKGPVRTEDERKNIEAKAVEIAGAGNVVNKITVKTDSSRRDK